MIMEDIVIQKWLSINGHPTLKSGRKMKLESKIIMSLIACIGISACDSNALFKTENLNHIQKALDELSFTDSDQSKCISFYANKEKNSTISSTCERWSKQMYAYLREDHEIPDKSSIDQFRDPKIWQLIQKRRSK